MSRNGRRLEYIVTSVLLSRRRRKKFLARNSSVLVINLRLSFLHPPVIKTLPPQTKTPHDKNSNIANYYVSEKKKKYQIDEIYERE